MVGRYSDADDTYGARNRERNRLEVFPMSPDSQPSSHMFEVPIVATEDGFPYPYAPMSLLVTSRFQGSKV